MVECIRGIAACSGSNSFDEVLPCVRSLLLQRRFLNAFREDRRHQLLRLQ